MHRKSSDLRKCLIISIYMDFLRFCFPFFCIRWLMGYIWASPASHRTTTEYRPKPRPALPEHPCLCRSSLAVASCAVLAGRSVAAVYDMRIFGCFSHEHIGRCIAAVTAMRIG